MLNASEYDTKGMGEFILYGGDGLYIDCKNRVNEIADIMHDLGFKMGGWYRSWPDLDGYTHMWLSRKNGEIHMNVCDHATISIEDLLEKFRIEEEEPVDVDLSALLFG